MSPPIEAMQSPISSCQITPIDSGTCERYLAWLSGSVGKPAGEGRLAWMLGHFDDGVTWGRCDEADTWTTSCAVPQDTSPRNFASSLLELRLFGPASEILIWRTPTGLSGRVVNDSPLANSFESDPLGPCDESRLVRGDRVQAQLPHNFTCVADATGANQALPIPVTDGELKNHRIRLRARHYFQQDGRTGAVRIALTRLVALEGGSHGA